MKNEPRFSEAEWRVMKLLWRRSPRTAQDLCDALEPETGWKPSTVKTLLSRLAAKGAVRHEPDGKAFLYSPAVDETACRRAEADSFLRRVFDGAVSPLMAHFVESHRLTDAQIAELERLLRQRKKGKRTKGK